MRGLSSSLSPFGQCHVLSGGLLCLEKYSYPQRTKQSQLDTCRLALCTLTQSSLPGSMLRRATGPVGSYTTTTAGDRGRHWADPQGGPCWVPLFLWQGPELQAVRSEYFSSPAKTPNFTSPTLIYLFIYQPAVPQRGTLVVLVSESYCSLLDF